MQSERIERVEAGIVAGLILVTLAAACERNPAADLSARDTYLRYCASCHGESGLGDGPAAGSLSRPPADLTRLAARNRGHFDERSVMASIDGRREVAAHGTREMPVWGAVFLAEGESGHYPAYQSLLKSRMIVDYLASIQVGAESE